MPRLKCLFVEFSRDAPKKDEDYPTGTFNLTGRETTKVVTVYLNQGEVIRSAVHIGTFGTAGTNTSAMGCLSYELKLVKLKQAQPSYHQVET